jgi:putative peptide zinc metalloprotease protein
MAAEVFTFPVDAVAPALAPQIRFGPPMRVAGRLVHHVKDSRSAQFYRIGPREHFVLSKLDGSHTFAKISSEHQRAFGREIPAAGWRQLLQLAQSRNMLAASATPGGNPAVDPLPRFSHAGYTAFYFRLLSPHTLLCQLDRYAGWIYSRPAALTLAAVILLAEAFVAFQAASLIAITLAALHQHLWPVFATFLAFLYGSLVIHEAAHGLTCAHFGGDVSDMGIMLRYLALFPYCKLNDLLVIPNRVHRAAIVLAGPTASLIVMLPFAVVYLAAPGGSLWKPVSALMLTVYNLLSLMNLIPFLQLDGYFLLSTWLGRPRLREEANQFFLRGIGLIGPASGETAVPREDRAFYFAYGLTSTLITTAFIGWGTFCWHQMLIRLTTPLKAWLAIAMIFLSVATLWILIRRRTQRGEADAEIGGKHHGASKGEV